MTYGAVEDSSAKGAGGISGGGVVTKRTVGGACVGTVAWVLLVAALARTRDVAPPDGITALDGVLATGGARPRVAQVYYINCDSSPERRALQEAALASWGVVYERFPCYTGETIDAVLSAENGLAVFRSQSLRPPNPDYDPVSIAHTVGNWFSHRALYERVADKADGSANDDDLYLILEDDAVLASGESIANVEEAFRSIPRDWAYASLNVHEAYCAEDFVNNDWLLKRGLVGADVYTGGISETCTAVVLDDEWRGFKSVGILPLYLSAAATVVRPRNARLAVAWLDGQPVWHNDAAMRTPDVGAFASYQFHTNLFNIDSTMPESRLHDDDP
ncbi:hypothetical protein M885DRAFT_562600 [Pelagophyceae sp. CCMP2097]|nr:hypothetical protein M885DRAFT_562600 [Pelagophyceae sp. CCMP2097]